MTSYSLHRLANGVRVAVAHLPDRESVALGLYTCRGSRHESERRQGIAHFVEHMVFKGTARRSARRISVEAEAVGGHLNAFTGEEQTCYHVKAPVRAAANMLDLLTDLYRNARFHERDILRERSVIEDEILLYREQPASHVEDLLAAAAWPGHPLGRPILGTPGSLARIDREALGAYRASAHSGINTVLAIGGALDPAQAVLLAEKTLGDLPAGRSAPRRPFRAPRSGRPRVVSETRPLEQAHLALAFHSGGWTHRDLAVSRVLSAVLGESMSSLLQQELREKRGICYDVSSERESFRDEGLLSIYAGMEASRFPEALGTLIRVLRGLRDRPLPARTVRHAIDCLIGQTILALEDTGHQMFWVGELVCQGRTQLRPHLHYDRLHQVGPSELQACARRLFRPGNAAAAVLGPDADLLNDLISKALHDLI